MNPFDLPKDAYHFYVGHVPPGVKRVVNSTVAGAGIGAVTGFTTSLVTLVPGGVQPPEPPRNNPSGEERYWQSWEGKPNTSHRQRYHANRRNPDDGRGR